VVATKVQHTCFVAELYGSEATKFKFLDLHRIMVIVRNFYLTFSNTIVHRIYLLGSFGF
jgi:hypothetical protein